MSRSFVPAQMAASGDDSDDMVKMKCQDESGMWMRSLAAVYKHDSPAGIVQVSAHMQRLGLVATCASCT